MLSSVTWRGFRVEAEAYACLNHPSIIKIRDVGVVSGCPFIAMDFAEHGSLDKYLELSPTRDVNWRVETVQRVAQALSHAHGRRILHRDLKPSNILVTGDGTPKLTDFGLVKFSAPLSAVNRACCTMPVDALDLHLAQIANENRARLPLSGTVDDDALVRTLATECEQRTGVARDSFDLEAVNTFIQRSIDTKKFSGELSPLLNEMTREGSVVGTPHFMSPEQARGQLDNIDPRTDVYGLGATLYSIVTGQQPASGRSIGEILDSVVRGQPVFPSSINANVCEDLSLVIMKSIEKNPEDRYANMEMFAEDLDRVLEGRAPLARLNRRSRSSTKQKSKLARFRKGLQSLSTLLPGTIRA